ncbi:uncharacterized protein PHALS_14130 [Plasmopara halstedii]|uniref:Uncharacterized protein n=1 Tax=Plasmopara halstedii TaxID=4781 RepID=A0A0P1AQM0_PLAHL|nr:uncharacterized protein PHALS_14130 [Plasmopara halstedii]CEG43841.1 hypothetical protein PHALS_14130 [Plasmopara halstedii]|eukprot:XP_024580210.1 hypothetical protein PHALS_14130 [Plasmopara halstedii]
MGIRTRISEYFAHFSLLNHVPVDEWTQILIAHDNSTSQIFHRSITSHAMSASTSEAWSAHSRVSNI